MDGAKYKLRFFYAQRQRSNSEFHLRTNLVLSSGRYRLPVTVGFD